MHVAASQKHRRLSSSCASVFKSCAWCCCCRRPLRMSCFAGVGIQERPSLSVLFPVVHPSVDPGGRLHTSLLTNWVYGSSRLSTAIAEAVAALTDSSSGGPSAASGSGAGAGAGVAADAGSEPHRVVPFPAGYPVPQGAPNSRAPHIGEQQQHNTHTHITAGAGAGAAAATAVAVAGRAFLLHFSTLPAEYGLGAHSVLACLMHLCQGDDRDAKRPALTHDDCLTGI